MPVRGKDFSWDVHGIFTQNENIVTELTSGVDRIQMAGIIAGINPYLEPGKPFGYLRGTVSARDAEGNLLIDPVTGWIDHCSMMNKWSVIQILILKWVLQTHFAIKDFH